MRRRDRELNIFSMSALDLFASALGAFILITLILLPYYLQKGPAETPAQQCPVPIPSPVCPVCPVPSPVPQCPEPSPPQVIVADNLLVMQMTWTASADIDMHVETPDGEFYYNRKHISGKPGKMIHDDQAGGSDATEIWLVHNPTPGNYKVCFKLYSLGNSGLPVSVGGVLDKPRGRVVLPTTQLTQVSQKKCVLEFSMSRDYIYTQQRP